ncbi:MAG: biopolymer transporter ExbD [Candidatus Cloacimonetes bacterium]|nr:biopolymer transporter ExbD [Candidatus Cloacimonadota bacterium]
MKLSVKKTAIGTTALTSIADIVFLLLIFLLLSSNFILSTGIMIDIPTSSNSYNEISKSIVLSINEKEEIFVNSSPVTEETLVTVLKAEIEKTSDTYIRIEADQTIALQKVINLVDAAKSAGSNRFFIAAQLQN